MFGRDNTPQRPRRVLVVDDDSDTAAMFAELLRAMRHHAVHVTNPLQAVEVAQAFRPEVAFLDLNMPKLDGYALARMFRGTMEFSGLKLVAVSGHDGAKDRRLSRQSGFDAHVAKPLDTALLESILAQLA